MPDDNAQVASGSTEPSPNGTPSDGATDWKAEATRLRQRIAEQQEIMRTVEPMVRTYEALEGAPGGKAILERVASGKPLTDAQEEKIEAAGLTLEKIEEVLDRKLAQEREARAAERVAARKVEEHHKALSKELPGYDALHKTSQWVDKYDSLYKDAVDGRLEIPVDRQDDPYKWLAERTYDLLVARNPELGKVTPAGKSENERKAAISRASGKPADASSGGEVLPEMTDDQRETLEFIRRRPQTTVGKRFS